MGFEDLWDGNPIKRSREDDTNMHNESEVTMVYPPKLGKSFIDENERDEDGEDFLGETRDVTHQEAALKGHNDHHNDDQPHSNPHSPNNVFDVLSLAELNEEMSNETQKYTRKFSVSSHNNSKRSHSQ